MVLKRRISPYVNKLFEGLASKIPFSPNILTHLSLVSAAAGAFFIYTGSMPLAIILVALAFALDGFDGLVARVQKKTTLFGGYLDGTTDRLVELFVLVAMMWLAWPLHDLALFSLVMFLSFGTFLTSFSMVYADHVKAVTDKEVLKKMECIFERTERTLLILTSLILYMYNPLYSQLLLSLGAILSLIAFLQRFMFVFNYTNSMT